jgi:hypothetical protein
MALRDARRWRLTVEVAACPIIGHEEAGKARRSQERGARPMNYSEPPQRDTRAEVLLDTLAHEKHARLALLSAFLDDLRKAASDRAPESTRQLLTRAESGDLSETDVDTLVAELRTVIGTAA